MSGGRFLAALREVLCFEEILQMRILLKENLNLWELDVRPEDNVLNITEKIEFHNDFEEIELAEFRKQESICTCLPTRFTMGRKWLHIIHVFWDEWGDAPLPQRTFILPTIQEKVSKKIT